MRNNDKYLKIMTMPVYIFVIYIAFDVFIENFDDIDVTGLGQLFLYVLVGIFTILGIICIKNAFIVPEKGVNYKFNKIIAIIFLLFSIICFSMGIYLRAKEEKMAKEYYGSFDFLTSDNLAKYLLDNSEAIDKLTEQKTRQNRRLEEIQYEINKEPNALYRYIIVFTTGMDLGTGVDGYDLGESLYYMAYTIITALSLYLGLFFSFNSYRIKNEI